MDLGAATMGRRPRIIRNGIQRPLDLRIRTAGESAPTRIRASQRSLEDRNGPWITLTWWALVGVGEIRCWSAWGIAHLAVGVVGVVDEDGLIANSDVASVGAVDAEVMDGLA